MLPTEHQPLFCKIPSSEGEVGGGLQSTPHSVRHRLAQGSQWGGDRISPPKSECAGGSAPSHVFPAVTYLGDEDPRIHDGFNVP